MPNTMWWTWVPFTERLPGHHFTPLRIMWVLVRMKPHETRNDTSSRNSASLPSSTMSSCQTLATSTVAVSIMWAEGSAPDRGCQVSAADG
jgi:hypothetical protein